MVKNHVCKFLVSQSQMEKIRNDARANGYISVSPYLRDLALQKSGFIEAKLIEINENVKKLLSP